MTATRSPQERTEFLSALAPVEVSLDLIVEPSCPRGHASSLDKLEFSFKGRFRRGGADWISTHAAWNLVKGTAADALEKLGGTVKFVPVKGCDYSVLIPGDVAEIGDDVLWHEPPCPWCNMPAWSGWAYRAEDREGPDCVRPLRSWPDNAQIARLDWRMSGAVRAVLTVAAFTELADEFDLLVGAEWCLGTAGDASRPQGVVERERPRPKPGRSIVW